MVQLVRMGMQVDVGGRIREARERAGMSQSQFAKKLGCAPRTLQSWERNERHPRPAALDKIARKTGHEVAWFFEPLPRPRANGKAKK